jgi:formylglycine-generating enzyme required for sulfatase activity
MEFSMKRYIPFLLLAAFLGTLFIAAGSRQTEAALPVQSLSSTIQLPEMALVPGGQFVMGDHQGYVDPAHPSDEVPLHTVNLDSFYMGVYEVTNQQYADYLNSALAQDSIEVRSGVVFSQMHSGLVYGKGTDILYFETSLSADYSQISWNGSVFSVLNNRGNHPVVGVRWDGAAAYANWLSGQNGFTACYDLVTGECDFTQNGYRLPTEAEWEYAGRGGQADPYYIFPWGDDADNTKANWPGSGDPYESGSLPWTTPVGFYNGQLHLKADFNWPGSQTSYQTANGVNGLGLYDMAGNVWEWVHDWYGVDYYANSPTDNPIGPVTGTLMPDGEPYRSMRGGNWYNGENGHSRVSNRDPGYYRGPQDPSHPYYHVGFRVARPATGTPAVPQTVGLFTNTSGAWEGYTLFAPKHYTTTYLINNQGLLVNSWSGSSYEPGQSAYLLENGHLLRAAMTKGPLSTGGGEGGRIEEYNWEGNLVWEFNYSTSQYMSHHDMRPLPSGNVLVLAVEKKTYAEALAAGFNPAKFQPEIAQKGYMLPDYVIEVKPTYPSGGQIVWEWHVWDHLIQDFDPAKANYGNVANHPELINADGTGNQIPSFWNHMNSIDYNPQLDQILLSVRGNSEIWIIDHSTTTAEAAGHTGGRQGKGGDLLYRWGNPLAYKLGTVSDQMFYQQHDAEWVVPGSPGAGNITVFNNGLGRNYSTVDEITPPVDENGGYTRLAGAAFGPQNFTWTYQATPPSSLYSGAISGAQRLPNGNTLIDDGVHGTFTEVTPGGDTVWKYINPVVLTGPMTQGDAIPLDPVRAGELMNAVFRIYRYGPTYPGLIGRDLTPGLPVELYSEPVYTNTAYLPIVLSIAP